MRIVHINTYDDGGAAVAMFRLHDALIKAEIDSHVLVLHRSSDEEIENLHVFTIPRDGILNKVQRKLGKTPTLREAHANILESNPANYETYTFPETDYDVLKHPLVRSADVVCLHWIARFIDYPSFFSGVDKPVVWVFHDMNAFLRGFHYKGDEKEFSHLFEAHEASTQTCKQSAYSAVKNLTVVAPSEWMAKASKKSDLTGRFAHKTIYNCGDSRAFHPINREQALHDLQLDNSKRYLLFMASNHKVRRKGQDLLNDALAELDLPDDVRLITIGSNIESHSDLVIPFGYVRSERRLNDMFNASLATIIPSREDNLPNVMVESLLAGTPVISFSNGGMSEIIQSKRNGLLVEEMSAQALANAIETVVQNGKNLFDRSYIAERALACFDPTRQAAGYIRLFKSLVEK
ncbi:MAG: glycosyltransferase [Cryomorphaceae bacterium]